MVHTANRVAQKYKKRCAEMYICVVRCICLPRASPNPENSCVVVGEVRVMRAAAMGAAHVIALLTTNYGYMYISMARCIAKGQP